MCDLLTGEAVVTPEEHSQPFSFHPIASLRPRGCFHVAGPEHPWGVPGGASLGGRNWKCCGYKGTGKASFAFYLLGFFLNGVLILFTTDTTSKKPATSSTAARCSRRFGKTKPSCPCTKEGSWGKWKGSIDGICASWEKLSQRSLWTHNSSDDKEREKKLWRKSFEPMKKKKWSLRRLCWISLRGKKWHLLFMSWVLRW